MNNQEFSDTFTTLLNSYNTQANFGELASRLEIVLDEYEKSVILTLALDITVKSYFEGTDATRLNFDSSSRRQIDFSSLIKTDTLTKKDGNLETFDDRGIIYQLPRKKNSLGTTIDNSTDVLYILNEKLVENVHSVPTTITVNSEHSEYSDLSIAVHNKCTKEVLLVINIGESAFDLNNSAPVITETSSKVNINITIPSNCSFGDYANKYLDSEDTDSPIYNYIEFDNLPTKESYGNAIFAYPATHNSELLFHNDKASFKSVGLWNLEDFDIYAYTDGDPLDEESTYDIILTTLNGDIIKYTEGNEEKAIRINIVDISRDSENPTLLTSTILELILKIPDTYSGDYFIAFEFDHALASKLYLQLIPKQGHYVLLDADDIDVADGDTLIMRGANNWTGSFGWEDDEDIEGRSESEVQLYSFTFGLDNQITNPLRLFGTTVTLVTLSKIVNNLFTLTLPALVQHTTNYVIVPINYKEYDREMSKPYGLPLKRLAWRLFQNQATGFDINAELIPRHTIKEGTKDGITTELVYKIRYVRRPRPIILEDLPDGLEIDGESNYSECELNPILHTDILNKAVEIAIATRGRVPAKLQES